MHLQASLTLAGAHSGRVTVLRFSPTRRHLLSGDVNGLVVLWDICSGAAIGRIEMKVKITALEWGGHSSKTAFVGLESGEVYAVTSFEVRPPVILFFK